MRPESDENLSIARKLLLILIQHFPPEWVVWGTEEETNMPYVTSLERIAKEEGL